MSAIWSLNRTPRIFEVISPKRSTTIKDIIYTTNEVVSRGVPSHSITSGVIYFSAMSIGALVTKSVAMRLVMRSRSLFFLSLARVRAHQRFWRINPSSLCPLTDMSGISVPAKKARARTNKRNKNMGRGSKVWLIRIKDSQYIWEIWENYIDSFKKANNQKNKCICDFAENWYTQNVLYLKSILCGWFLRKNYQKIT